jgi:hypothetical protein
MRTGAASAAGSRQCRRRQPPLPPPPPPRARPPRAHARARRLPRRAQALAINQKYQQPAASGYILCCNNIAAIHDRLGDAATSCLYYQRARTALLSSTVPRDVRRPQAEPTLENRPAREHSQHALDHQPSPSEPSAPLSIDPHMRTRVNIRATTRTNRHTLPHTRRRINRRLELRTTLARPSHDPRTRPATRGHSRCDSRSSRLLYPDLVVPCGTLFVPRLCTQTV